MLDSSLYLSTKIVLCYLYLVQSVRVYLYGSCKTLNEINVKLKAYATLYSCFSPIVLCCTAADMEGNVNRPISLYVNYF
jgi:hypothetical protein